MDIASLEHMPASTARAWMVHAWRGVPWAPPADDQPAEWVQWRHMRTVVLERDAGLPAQGESIWVLDRGGERLGAAWEWIEWEPGVIILKDPMCIVSNVAWPDAAAALPRSVALASITHALPWQDEVARALAGPGPGTRRGPLRRRGGRGATMRA